MSGLQLAILAGSLTGLGFAVVLWALVPVSPDLGDVLRRLSPEGARMAQQQRIQVAAGDDDFRDSLGRWAGRALPARVWGAVSAQDLAVMRVTPTRFYGEKVTFGLLGLMIVPFLSGVAWIVGISLPVFVPVLGSLLLGVALWYLPNYNITDDAKKARLEYTRSLGAFIDLVALERNGGSGPRQSMEAAAGVGDSWPFKRLSEELARTRWSGVTPWDAMRHLGEELGIPEMHDFADIMRLSGEDGAQIYTILRARSSSMREAMLSAQKAQANEISERMTLPMSLLGVLFLVILVSPAMLGLLATG
ncbi:type II secretion system F family protein [Ornithinimicrobium sp. Arc0846-15]|nr:type II secretion system F family protein [Ornithinimicrobium laminariae]